MGVQCLTAFEEIILLVDSLRFEFRGERLLLQKTKNYFEFSGKKHKNNRTKTKKQFNSIHRLD